MTSIFHLFLRKCNGDRTWGTIPNESAKPQYDCGAWGQMHYRTFDGRMFKFDGGQCEYLLMSDCRSDPNKDYCDINAANINVKIRNKRCQNSYEAYMCKQVSIEMKTPEGTVEITLMQEQVTVKRGITSLTFEKGTYPQPQTAVMNGVEVFKVCNCVI